MPSAAAGARPTPVLSQEAREAIHWKAEAQRAFKERDEIKRSFQATGGPGVFWRDQAKDASKKLADALRLVGTLRQADRELRAQAIQFSEDADALRARIADLKIALFELWSDVPDGSPLKASLVALGATLA